MPADNDSRLYCVRLQVIRFDKGKVTFYFPKLTVSIQKLLTWLFNMVWKTIARESILLTVDLVNKVLPVHHSVHLIM